MAGIPDSEMVRQLNAFMHAVIAQWSWDELSRLFQGKHVEYRGPESNLLTFDIDVLEHALDAPRPYLNVAFHVCDLREDKGLGSAYQPLGNNFIYYRDGEIDFVELKRFAYAWQDE
jgi:hypothetical protein